jgi:Zn-dependent protease
VEIEGIELWLLGGVAKMKGMAHKPEEELRFALAGPGVTVVIAAVFWLAVAVLPESTPDAPGLLWLGLIGIFLIVAGKSEESGVEIESTFAGRR